MLIFHVMKQRGLVLELASTKRALDQQVRLLDMVHNASVSCGPVATLLAMIHFAITWFDSMLLHLVVFQCRPRLEDFI